MKNFSLFLFILPLIILSPINSQETTRQNEGFATQVKSAVRPFFQTLLGDEITVKILGDALDSLEIPELPDIIKDAKDASVKKSLNQIELSKEQWLRYNQNFVIELYQVVRKDQANRNDLSKWMNVLEQGGTHEGVYRAMVLDQSYAGLENYPNDVNDHVVEFTQWYMKKFNNRDFEKEAIQGVNFFSVKRIMTEHSLDMFDALARKGAEDVYRWYAVLSGELARRYPEAFRNELRESKTMAKHQHWASQMPEQLIKSEMIIKLHLVFNFIQG